MLTKRKRKKKKQRSVKHGQRLLALHEIQIHSLIVVHITNALVVIVHVDLDDKFYNLEKSDFNKTHIKL